MSASRAAELIVHHTQAASYHQGREYGRQEAMRLVRQIKHRAVAERDLDAVIHALNHLEDVLRDLTNESDRAKIRHNAVLREVTDILTAATS